MKPYEKYSRQLLRTVEEKMNMIHEAFFTILALPAALMNVGILLYAWRSRTMSIGEAVAMITLFDHAGGIEKRTITTAGKMRSSWCFSGTLN